MTVAPELVSGSVPVKVRWERFSSTFLNIGISGHEESFEFDCGDGERIISAEVTVLSDDQSNNYTGVPHASTTIDATIENDGTTAKVVFGGHNFQNSSGTIYFALLYALCEGGV